MERYVGRSKEQLEAMPLEKLTESVNKHAWVALEQYFGGKGNGPEAKIAVVVIGTVVKQRAIENTTRQLDIITQRLHLKK
jgi:hypothetical protein